MLLELLCHIYLQRATFDPLCGIIQSFVSVWRKPNIDLFSTYFMENRQAYISQGVSSSSVRGNNNLILGLKGLRYFNNFVLWILNFFFQYLSVQNNYKNDEYLSDYLLLFPVLPFFFWSKKWNGCSQWN